MRIAQFEEQLSTGSGPGARWLKTDFHIHMPGSADYEYKGADALQQMAQKLRAGAYDVVVVLKHQEYPSPAELADLQRLVPNIKLLPAAEINVFVDAMGAKVAKDHFFHAIVVSDPDAGAAYSYPLERAKRELSYRNGDYPAGFTSSILDVGRFLQKEGALFIPAHLHQSKPPHHSRSIDDIYEDEAFLRFIRDGAFSALEVRQISTAAVFVVNRNRLSAVLLPVAAAPGPLSWPATP
jgi:hypothetical protein